MNYVFAYDHRHELPSEELRALIGGKAASLATMATELGLPVPPAFTISTAACKAYLAGGWPAGLDDELRLHMARLEDRVGRRFADPNDPLLVSVRSGAPVSMPGMMDTLLNVGLNDQTAAGLARASGSPGFAADCHARFLELYREIVGPAVPPVDPWEQLRQAIEAVFRSWNSERARAYRAHERISDALGTGVTVQAMVFGNRGGESATGVLFTRNPCTGEAVLYGDVLFDAQGEDVVAGTHRTEPISCLDTRMPEVAAELRRHAAALERHYADLCDIEFTIEERRLWMLQVRVGKRSPQAACRIAVDMAEAADFPVTRAEAVRRVASLLARPPTRSAGRIDVGAPLTVGLPAAPGVACGEIVTTPEAAVEVAEAGRAVILVRAQTSPDDVHGMARAAGILTATGGLASHAAVVARGWGIPAVVGAAAVAIGEGSIAIAGRRMAVGEQLTIDGSTGEVFAGRGAGVTEVIPEAARLLSWARELGIAVGEEAERAAGAVAAPPFQPSTGCALRALAIKGYCTLESAADALLCQPEEARALLAQLIEAQLAEPSKGSYRLTPAGKARARELLASDAQAWGPPNAAAALDAFVALDRRMKQTVTAWQLREVGGAPAVNDHGDAAYDAEVLARFDQLHGDAAAWLRPLSTGLPRLASYDLRLGRAASAVRAGDPRFVASPRVDSYHGVWFELHEDLIHLAGRTRAAEAAAGRA